MIHALNSKLRMLARMHSIRSGATAIPSSAGPNRLPRLMPPKKSPASLDARVVSLKATKFKNESELCWPHTLDRQSSSPERVAEGKNHTQ